MMTIPTRLRQREILNAQLIRCQRVDNPFTRGAAAALRWLAVGGPGPLTGAVATPINFEVIVRELATAEAIIYGPLSDGRQYARGVEHALMWAESATSGPPVPDGGRGQSLQSEVGVTQTISGRGPGHLDNPGRVGRPAPGSADPAR
jgi:hypothetical protein